MMKKTKKILFGLMFAAALYACDIDGMKEAALTLIEKTGAYGSLTLLNLPPNTGAILVVKVGDAGVRDDTAGVTIEGGGAVIPLANLNGGTFDKSGAYPVTLLMEIGGAETLIGGNAELLVKFVDGKGTADLSEIEIGETEEAEEADYNLIILNLPERTDADSFKTLQIGDYVARCADFNTITVKETTAYVPLINQKGERFGLTGSFYIGLNVEVDSFNIAAIAYREHYVVHFTSGKGIFDIKNPGEQMVIGATLKLINLPSNTDAESFTLVNVGGIARCLTFDQILVKPAEREAQIPLVVNDGKTFDKTGTYYIVMRIIVDSLNDINITEADYIMVEFSGGYGVLDMNNVYNNMKSGYLSGHLTNEGNYYEPKVAGGTIFELLGNYFRVVGDETIKTSAVLQAMPDGIVYVYAVPNEKFVINAGILHYTDTGYADIRFSKDTPAYNDTRSGWYYGNQRALWKFLKLGGEYRYKVRVEEDFPFDHDVISAPTGTLRDTFTGDIYPVEVTLEPGFYCFEAAGAAGGEGGDLSIVSSHWINDFNIHADGTIADFEANSSAAGGRIIELINVKKTRTFLIYTGAKGKAGAGSASATGDLNIVGGGGGAGSYISDGVGVSKGYLLCAGGGGGGYINSSASFKYIYYGRLYYDSVFWGIVAEPYTIVKVGISGGNGGSGGGGGAGGWVGVVSGEAGRGGGYWGGVPYYEPDGGGIIKLTDGYPSCVVENSVYSASYLELDGNDQFVNIVVTAVSRSYDVRQSGGGSSMFTAPAVGGKGGYITEGGVIHAPTSGGNNRTSARGGNFGDGYVKIYKLL
ncbi:MAG: hypothetical protein LBF83_04250 [Spirochaetaceae bacterium]|jgi:hypothetical protein|nr:hypothetical protein [Spirochaetaceae bacterium]